MTIRCVTGVTVRRERRWTSAGASPVRELVRSTLVYKPSKTEIYFNFSYSALAAFKTGTSGSASFHIAKKS
jgi:hypothetical protein